MRTRIKTVLQKPKQLAFALWNHEWTMAALAIFTFLFNLAIIEHGSGLWQLNLVVVLAIVGRSSYVYGVKKTQQWFNNMQDEVMGQLPEDVIFHHDEDTDRRTAIITKRNGDMVTVEIPSEITNPHEAMRYILEQQANNLPED